MSRVLTEDSTESTSTPAAQAPRLTPGEILARTDLMSVTLRNWTKIDKLLVMPDPGLAFTGDYHQLITGAEYTTAGDFIAGNGWTLEEAYLIQRGGAQDVRLYYRKGGGDPLRDKKLQNLVAQALKRYAVSLDLMLGLTHDARSGHETGIVVITLDGVGHKRWSVLTCDPSKAVPFQVVSAKKARA